MLTKNPARKAKTSRTLKVIIPLLREPSCGVIEVREGKQTDTYYVAREHSDETGERGFRVTKVSDASHEGYDVLLAGGGYQCHCKGYLRYEQCRHGAMIQALDNRGRL